LKRLGLTNNRRTFSTTPHHPQTLHPIVIMSEPIRNKKLDGMSAP